MTERPRPHDLEELLLGSAPRYSRREVAAMTGVPVERSRRYWRALGFADIGDDAVLTDYDAAVLTRVLALVDEGVLSEDRAVGLVRAVGLTSSRLADWVVDLVGEQLSGGTGLRDGLDVASLYTIADRLLPDLQALLVYAWRRRLAAAVRRTIEDDELHVDAAHLTVGFADLVGFTRLARRLEERELAELVERFEQRAADVVAASGGRLVKTLGDEVLFVAEDAPTAAATALSLLETFEPDDSVPDLRVGLASGLVVSRMGDVFGTTVNLASRLTTLARPGSVLCDAPTAAALADDPALVTVALWRRPLRGLGLVEPYAVRRTVGRPAVPAAPRPEPVASSERPG